MSNNLSRHTAQSVTRATGRALDRTHALGAIAAEDIAIISEAGREVMRSALQRGLERRAIEELLPECSGELEYVSTALIVAQVARVQRLAREL